MSHVCFWEIVKGPIRWQVRFRSIPGCEDDISRFLAPCGTFQREDAVGRGIADGSYLRLLEDEGKIVAASYICAVGFRELCGWTVVIMTRALIEIRYLRCTGSAGKSQSLHPSGTKSPVS
jgi:hypothetical protein